MDTSVACGQSVVFTTRFVSKFSLVPSCEMNILLAQITSTFCITLFHLEFSIIQHHSANRVVIEIWM